MVVVVVVIVVVVIVILIVLRVILLDVLVLVIIVLVLVPWRTLSRIEGNGHSYRRAMAEHLYRVTKNSE